MKADTRALLTALGIARSQSDEANVRPLDGGWQVHCMSPDGASMVNVVLHAEVFAEGVDGTPEEFVMDLDRWMKALRTTGSTTEISFEDGLIRLKGDGMRHTFRMLAPPEAKNRFRMPDLKEKGLLTGECMMETDRLRRLLSSIDEKRVDDITVSIADGTLGVTAYDEALNGVDLAMTAEECAVLDGEGRSMFSREMWQDFMKVVPADTVIDLSIGTDTPCTVEFGDRVMDTTWLCAPKIATE